jgi:phosphate transport system permease protein
MAVLMVTGNAAVIRILLKPVRTIPATIAAELGESCKWRTALSGTVALGCILFIITFGINMLVEMVTNSQ